MIHLCLEIPAQCPVLLAILCHALHVDRKTPSKRYRDLDRLPRSMQSSCFLSHFTLVPCGLAYFIEDYICAQRRDGLTPLRQLTAYIPA